MENRNTLWWTAVSANQTTLKLAVHRESDLSIRTTGAE